MKYTPPEGEVLELLQKLNIKAEGEYTVELESKDTIVLLHYKTRHNVIIRKGDKPTWL